jgi:glycosyltransferase involved in cell wall biosynthesis
LTARNHPTGPTLGYLSAAPRVSTRPEAEASGPRAHVLGVIRAFEALGWEVKPFVVGDRLPARASGRGTERALSANPLQTLAADVVRLILGRVNARRAARELTDVDWVYERFATLQTLGHAFQRRGVPWILETQGIYFEEAKTERKSLILSGPARRMEVAAYRDCDVLVCVTHSLKRLVVERTGADPEKILVVPNGVDAVLFDPERHQPKRLSEDFTVGFVGTLLEWQGLELLVRAVAALRRAGLAVSTTVVGDGPARAALERLARELGVREHVRFAGRVPMDEVPAYIAGFDAGYAGHAERSGAMYHSPLKLYEYAAMGKPLLASDFDDARSLAAGAEGAGFLFRPGDREDLERAIREAVAARGSSGARAREIRAACVRKHSWEARVRRMVPQVEEILARKR